MSNIFRHLFFIFFILLISCIFTYNFFYTLYISSTVIIPYGLTEFDICTSNPVVWKYLKFLYIIFFILANIICSNALFSLFPKQFSNKKNKKPYFLSTDDSFNIFIGTTLSNEPVTITEKGLYQNFLITGTIRYRQNFFRYVSYY